MEFWRCKYCEPAKVLDFARARRRVKFSSGAPDGERLPCRGHALEEFRGGHRVPIGWLRIHQLIDFGDSEDDERPVGPTWWCHVAADHPFVQSWLSNAQWLHPAISISLRDESRLMSERTKHLLYEVPARVAGGLPFEMSGGSATVINILGVLEVQEPLVAGGSNIPQSIHEVLAHLAGRLPRWMTRVIRVKWSLHAREEIVSERAWTLLESIQKSTREMIEEQEAVRGGLFSIQDVMWITDKSLTVTHKLGVFGGCGLVLSIITGPFGINVGGIPRLDESPYVLSLFSCFLPFLGATLIALGLFYLGLEHPIVEENVEVRKLEHQELVHKFQHEAESHAKVCENVP
ncbi:hypothetical protein EUGRSUZ_A01984 [Eucalyptus grandis]|uniref:Uncharacterized protein n=2 Tax=Eucalyptus grandis TaxID=71139 RepID=A0ACC3M624_EUCGR|nr:hypothetical protein EUGRSUZ_A01984 [Eucalyptus grandis]